jgi:hypothetical protein
VAEKGWVRLRGVSRGGKYALCHLLAFSLALLALLVSGGALAYVLVLLLGLPLLCLPMLLPDLPKHWPPVVGVLLFVGLMVVNSYLVGYAAAWVMGRVKQPRRAP